MQSHTHQRPEEAPLLTAHINLASYVGDRARVGFCCHGTRAGESARLNRGCTDDVEPESCCKDAASGRHPIMPMDTVAEDRPRYVIRSWRFEMTRRPPMSTAQVAVMHVSRHTCNEIHLTRLQVASRCRIEPANRRRFPLRRAFDGAFSLCLAGGRLASSWSSEQGAYGHLVRAARGWAG